MFHMVDKLPDCSLPVIPHLHPLHRFCSTVKFYRMEKGPSFTTTPAKLETDLTAEMIASGSWAQHQFKAYNFESRGVEPKGGHLHPLLKVAHSIIVTSS